MKRLFAAALLGAGALTGVAFADGTTSAEFLLLGAGARAEGLSGAYTAVSADANSIYWNTAGLAGIHRPQISLTYNSWLAEISNRHITFAIPSSKTRDETFGLGIQHVDYGEIEGRRNQTAAAKNFSASDLMISLAYATRMYGGFSSGMAFKFIRQNIDDVTAVGFTTDWGIRAKIFRGFVAGAAFKNVSGELNFIQKSEKLPTALNFGFAYAIGGMQFSVDVKRLLHSNRTEINAGTEITPFSVLHLRCGLLRTDAFTRDTQYRFSGGFGLKLGGNEFDYAFTPVGILGPTHKVTLTVKF